MNKPIIHSDGSHPLKILPKNISFNNEKNNQILQNVAFKINKSSNSTDNDSNSNNSNLCHTPVQMNSSKFTFENFFPDKNKNNNVDEDNKNDNLFKETPHFFPNVKENNCKNNYIYNNIKTEIDNRKNKDMNLIHNINNNPNEINRRNQYKKYTIEENQRINSERINPGYINNNNIILPNLINENVVNKEIQNLFENIPSQLRNDPDLKEKVGELLQNINEMKAFIETKKEQNLMKKRPKSGNPLKIKNLRNDEHIKIEKQCKNKLSFNQNNLINKKPPITERLINKNKKIKNNYNNNNYNIQKQNLIPSKVNNKINNNTRYFQK